MLRLIISNKDYLVSDNEQIQLKSLISILKSSENAWFAEDFREKISN